jgi:hypothetical protein
MAEESNRDQGGWHLGPDPAESRLFPAPHQIEPAPIELAREHRYERLDSPLYVLTVERAALFTIAVWALATRLFALAMRPLSASEASHALLDLQIADAGREALLNAADPLSTLTHLMGAALFHLMPPDDFSARIGFALCGLLLVAIAFTMRSWLGRAGTIAFAALLAASPSCTWFSRASAPPIAAAVFTLLAFRIGLEFFTAATTSKALALGVAIGAALSISPDLLVTLATLGLVALLTGLYELLFALEFGERLLFWISRNAKFAITATLSAAVVWLTLATGLFAHRLPLVDSRIIGRWTIGGYREGWLFYLPALSLYEFLTILFALAGLGLFAALRISSRLAGWTFSWALLALAIYPLCPVRNYLMLLQMMLPLSLMAAIAADFCYQSVAWSFIRYPLVVLGVLTVYVQLMANFVHPAADASEARSSRHGPVFWTEPATTVGTRDDCDRIENLYDNQGTLASRSFFDSTNSPALQWYLRDLIPADKAQGADVTAVSGEAAPLGESAPAPNRESVTFDLQDVWLPNLFSANAADLVRYLLTMRVWAPIESQQVTLSYAVVTSAPATPSPAPTALETTGSEPPTSTAQSAFSPQPSATSTSHTSSAVVLPSPAPASSVAPSSATLATPAATATPAGAAAP